MIGYSSLISLRAMRGGDSERFFCCGGGPTHVESKNL